MQTGSVALAPSRRWKSVLGTLALLALGGVVSYSMVRENRTPVASVVLDAAPSKPSAAPDRPALSAAEERYAAELWHVHETVKTSALRMTFAGLAYKMGDTDRAGVKQRVEPLIQVFATARTQAAAIPAPPSRQKMQTGYLDTLRLYERAAREMVKVARDGSDEHLIRAQEMSAKASGGLLEVGDSLWPGEYKPN